MSDSTAAKALEKLIGRRCKTLDKLDFPELKEDERCGTCEMWEAVDDLLASELKRIGEEAIIGEDEPEILISSKASESIEPYFRNRLRAEQRQRLTKAIEQMRGQAKS